MADPVTLAAVGIGAGVASGGIGALGSLFQGKSQSNLYNYQAGIAQQNAALATQDANYAISTGEIQTQQVGMQTRAQVGATRAGFGASNVDVNSGSSSKVISSETSIGQENEAVTSANAAKRAFGFNVKGAMDTGQAGVYSTAATNSTTAGEFGAASSIIGAAGNVSSKWLQMGQSFGQGGNSSTPPSYFGNTGGDQSSWYGG